MRLLSICSALSGWVIIIYIDVPIMIYGWLGLSSLLLLIALKLPLSTKKERFYFETLGVISIFPCLFAVSTFERHSSDVSWLVFISIVLIYWPLAKAFREKLDRSATD